MRLLIVTQAVNRQDPVLGFFHGWIAHLAPEVSFVHVICLKEGMHALPPNTAVHSLGKEKRAASKIVYSWRFLLLAWRLRKEYDAVFVHMNEEYVLIGGLVWRLWGKRVVLWRNHKMGSIRTRIAGLLAHTACHTSPEAYVARFSNARIMPIGIDTHTFRPSATLAPSDTVLFLGRLDAVKKPEVFLDAMARLAKEGSPAKASVYGDPTPGREAFAQALKERYRTLPNTVFHPGVTQEGAAELYRTHAIYVNTTPSGSFDKTIGEAMASGCLVVACNSAVREIVGAPLFMQIPAAQDAARALTHALACSDKERRDEAARMRAWIQANHSLERLLNALLEVLKI
jgi:glycosyltransferase involved in cell wall biosynthesis